MSNAHRSGEPSQAARNSPSTLPSPGEGDMEDGAGDDELRACLEILEEILKDPRASPFGCPVDPIKDKVPQYTKVVKKPMDLGTVQLNFHRGAYKTAQELREDVVLVWKNCLVFNGPENELYHDAKQLAEKFDAAYTARVAPPLHQGVRHFTQGEACVGLRVRVHWKLDHEWYGGTIVAVQADGGYLVEYDDGEKETVRLPSVDVCFDELDVRRRGGKATIAGPGRAALVEQSAKAEGEMEGMGVEVSGENAGGAGDAVDMEVEEATNKEPERGEGTGKETSAGQMSAEEDVVGGGSDAERKIVKEEKVAIVETGILPLPPAYVDLHVPDAGPAEGAGEAVAVEPKPSGHENDTERETAAASIQQSKAGGLEKGEEAEARRSEGDGEKAEDGVVGGGEAAVPEGLGQVEMKVEEDAESGEKSSEGGSVKAGREEGGRRGRSVAEGGSGREAAAEERQEEGGNARGATAGHGGGGSKGAGAGQATAGSGREAGGAKKGGGTRKAQGEAARAPPAKRGRGGEGKGGKDGGSGSEKGERVGLAELAACGAILEELLEAETAEAFSRPVDPVKDEVPEYAELIEHPMDLGTVKDKYNRGAYLTAQELREDVVLVWKNCLVFNGPENELYHDAKQLAEKFDAAYTARVAPPLHQGVRHFTQGEACVGLRVRVHWKLDHEWYAARVAGLQKDEATGEVMYRLVYDMDDMTEEIKLPSLEVAFTALPPSVFPPTPLPAPSVPDRPKASAAAEGGTTASEGDRPRSFSAKRAEQVEQMTKEDVGAFVRQVGLGEYEQGLREMELDGEGVMQLHALLAANEAASTALFLRLAHEMGLCKLGHALKFARHIRLLCDGDPV